MFQGKNPSLSLSITHVDSAHPRHTAGIYIWGVGVGGGGNFRCMETLTSNGFWVKRHTVLKNENLSLEWNQVEYGAVRLSRCKFQVNFNVIFNLFFSDRK